MRAVGLDYDARQLTEREIPEPGGPREDEVLFRVHEIGVCGTDRGLAHFDYGSPPEGERFLTLGHEALAQAVECGAHAANIRPGDWLVPTVRRGCSPPCLSCDRGRADLCVTGRYRERGILGMHGYFREYATDSAEDLVLVPDSLVDVAVLLEPLSVVEKAIEIALRFHEPDASSAIVLGAGTIGILAALVLQLRGLTVTIHSLEPEDSPRARLIRGGGFAYGQAERADILIEATGSAEAILRGIQMLAPLGVMAVLGAAEAQGRISFTRMVLDNQVVAGSVNASPLAWHDAVADLGRMPRDFLKRLIHRVPCGAFRESILEPSPPSAAPKIVHVLN